MYNVFMNTISAKLTTSGNSKAIRLPKALLDISKISDEVELEAKRGKIIIYAKQTPQAGWAEQIARVHKKYNRGALDDPELNDWSDIVADGLGELEEHNDKHTTV